MGGHWWMTQGQVGCIQRQGKNQSRRPCLSQVVMQWQASMQPSAGSMPRFPALGRPLMLLSAAASTAFWWRCLPGIPSAHRQKVPSKSNQPTRKVILLPPIASCGPAKEKLRSIPRNRSPRPRVRTLWNSRQLKGGPSMLEIHGVKSTSPAFTPRLDTPCGPRPPPSAKHGVVLFFHETPSFFRISSQAGHAPSLDCLTSASLTETAVSHP